MVIINPITGLDESHKGKSFDNPGYEAAAKKAGWDPQEAYNYWQQVRNNDPYARAGQSISDSVSAQAPKVGVSDGKITISAPQNVLDSPYIAQLESELQSLKGSDLTSAEVVNAIDALNKEIQANLSNAMIEETLKWTPEEYEDYQYTVQTLSDSNPMRSSNKIKGYDKDNKIVMKTPQEWVDYYRQVYSTDERSDALTESAKADNPYARTMYLVLTQGKDYAVYGFDKGERMAQGLNAAWNQLKKFPEGVFRTFGSGSDSNTHRVEQLMNKLKIPTESLRSFDIADENAFNQKKQELEGKAWSELSDDDKAFLVELGVSMEDDIANALTQEEKDELMKSYKGSKNNTLPWQTNDQDYKREENRRVQEYKKQLLDTATSGDDDASRAAISKILSGDNSYDKYKTVRNNFDTWQGYDDITNQDDLRLIKNAIWSAEDQQLGNMAGTIGRYFWEAAVIKALTGGLIGKGVYLNAISDKLGANIVNSLAAHGFSPASGIGRMALQFGANVLGTVPEDLIQTAVDNVLTYNAQENKNLLNFGEMAENTKRNFITMLLFGVAKAGIGSIRMNRLIKRLEQQADLDTPIDIEGIASDADDVARAAKEATDISVENGEVSVKDTDGKSKTLKNMTPEDAQMVQMSLFDDTEAAGYTRVGPASQNSKISDAVSEDLQYRWYEVGDRTAREEIADILESNSEARNASLNKFYEDYLYWQRAVDNTPLSFEEWLNTPITLYRYGDATADTNSNTLSYSVAPGGLSQFGGDLQVITLRPIDTLGRSQLTGTAAENEVFVRRSVADNSAPQPGSFEAALVKDNVLTDGEKGDKTFARRALTKRTVDVWGKENLEDGDTVYRSSQEADDAYGHENVKQHTIGIDDAEWSDMSHAKYSPESNNWTTKGTENGVPKVDTSGIRKTMIDVETPDGTTRVEVPDYRPRSVSEALDIDVEATPGAVKNWHTKSLEAAMDSLQANIDNFHNKFGDVQVSDFDWVWYQTKQGLTPEQIIGTTDPTTGRVITKNTIEAIKWWGEQPFVKDLRMASREALGYDDDFNVLGYLPHTDYDPSNLSFEEVLSPGQLWQKSTGASVLDDDGNYKGYGGDFSDRYRTFASNMLWDAKSSDVAAAKVMEEAQMDGVELTPQKAGEVVDGAKKINKSVADSSSVKEVEKSLLSDSDDIDYEQIQKNTKKDAEKLGLGKAIHDNWSEVYSGANSGKVVKQSGTARQAFDTLGNTMRNTQIVDNRGRVLNMYDSGGADIVYSTRSATEIVDRCQLDGNFSNLREYVKDYYYTHAPNRSSKYNEYYVDKTMSRIGDIKGELTKAKVIHEIDKVMKGEAYSRLRKFLVVADYDSFNKSTKNMIDKFLFSHMQTDAVVNSSKIVNKLSKVLSDITGLRYRALFYGNIKNALLQVTELNRYFSAFKWGDVAKMAQRLATDENFRARVDIYTKAVAPTESSFKADLYQAYSDVADSMETTKDGTVFNKLKNAKETADTIGLAPIEAAESYKNRMIVAGLVQEADRLGLTGAEALSYIRGRFERVALAMDELGQLGLASNPIGRTALFLQNFQIRELGMHLYNIKDATGMGASVPKKIINATKYLAKVLGAKMGTTLLMARLGYSATQTLGLDPFGILDSYNDIDEDEMEGLDYFFKSPLFAGGMTSIISDIYFMSRRAYEDSNVRTATEEAEDTLNQQSSFGLAFPSFDDLMGLGAMFVPGSTTANRIGQMNDMMNSGWAISSTGNKMYTAPTDSLNIALGYLFGRSATQNALQYNQNLGDNLGQSISRTFVKNLQNLLAKTNMVEEYQEFDPIDTKNYSDWFKGDGNDLQQFEKGKRYFNAEKKRIIETYRKVINDTYDEDEIAEAKNSMEKSLDELFNRLERFVAAYEKKNGSLTPNMVKKVLNILKIDNDKLFSTSLDATQDSLDEYSKAYERYTQLGLTPIGTYTGPTEKNPDKEVEYQGSPQWRAAKSAKYNLADEAVYVLRKADEALSEERKKIKQELSDAYDAKDYNLVEEIQQEYLNKFDGVVSPIIALYGNSVLDSTDVTNQLKDMLSTGTSSRSGDLIPSDQYRKDKYGRYRSMPLETVDVKKWAKQRFDNDLYKNPTVNYNSTANEDLSEIRKLLSEGRKSRARARALQLWARVENKQRSLSNDDYTWLINFINKGEE